MNIRLEDDDVRGNQWADWHSNSFIFVLSCRST